MINYIGSWAEQIIICVIVVTILEMILPKGNSQKYIKTIIGVYVLYTIISPVIKFFNGGELKIDYSNYAKYFETSEVSGSVNAVSIEDTYNIQLERQIKKDIEDMGYNVRQLTSKLDLESGSITSVNLSIDKNVKNNKDINISVDKIEVGNVKEENNLSEEEIKKIKQKINEDYGVSYENIIVNSM